MKTTPEQYFPELRPETLTKCQMEILVHQKRLASHFYFVFVLKTVHLMCKRRTVQDHRLNCILLYVSNFKLWAGKPHYLFIKVQPISLNHCTVQRGQSVSESPDVHVYFKAAYTDCERFIHTTALH